MTRPRLGASQAASSSAVLLAGQVFSKGFFILSAMLLARALDDASFGAVTLFMSIGQIFLFVVDSGYSVVLNRLLSLAPRELVQLFPPAMGTRLVLSAVSIALSAAAGALLGLDLGRILVMAVIFTAFSGEAVSELSFGVFRAFQKTWLESASRILGALAGLLFTVLVVLRFPGAVVASMTYLVRSGLMAFVCLFFVFRMGVRRPPVFSPGPAIRTLTENRHIWAMGLLLICAQRLDSVILRAFLTEEAVGAYQECFRIVDTLTLIITPTLLPGSLFPRLCRAFAGDQGETRRLLSRIGSLVTGLALLLTPPVMIGGRDLMEALWGGSYLRGQTPEAFGTCFILCVASVPAVFWVNYLLAGLLAAGRQKTALRAAAAAFGLSLGGNLVLVPAMGLAGSALAMLASNCIMVFVLASGYTWFERSGFLHELWRVAPGAGAAGIAYLAFSGSQEIPLGLIVGASFAAGWLPFSGISLLRRKN